MKRTTNLWMFFLGPVGFKLDWHHPRHNGLFFTRSAKDDYVYETWLGIMRIHTGDPQADGWVWVCGPLVLNVAWFYSKPSRKRDLKCQNPNL